MVSSYVGENAEFERQYCMANWSWSSQLRHLAGCGLAALDSSLLHTTAAATS